MKESEHPLTSLNRVIRNLIILKKNYKKTSVQLVVRTTLLVTVIMKLPVDRTPIKPRS
jgi:hypothetical protein